MFGLSNLKPSDIEIHHYDALEPSLRVTDKRESDGTKNDGTLMVRRDDQYAKIINPLENQAADFRMARELSLNYFLASSNTGPATAPYGNGGLRYDELYMAKGQVLTSPLSVPSLR